MVNEELDSDQEIKCRIEPAKTAFLKIKNKIFTDKNLDFSVSDIK